MSGVDQPGLDGLTPLRSLELIPDDLGRRVWEFGLLGQGPYARHVRLLPDGRIAGQLGDNESFWRIEGGRLILLNGADQRSTVFDRVYAHGGGRLAFVGPFQAPGGRDHILREVPPPGGLAPKPEDLELIWRRRQAPRPNLVIVRANERSLHVGWPRDIAESDRSWDLCVSFYGHEDNFKADPWSEYRVLQNRQRKFEALHGLLHVDSPLWGYDYIALPDDDLMLSWRDWNRLFATCRKHRLDLAQPALSDEGHTTHPLTARDPRYLLRFVSFVETMTPIFSREALRACVPTFQGSVSGFGLDNTWPKLLGKPRDRIAIIDETPAIHTRQQGRAYDIDGAIREGNDLQWRHDAPSLMLEYGGVFAEPVDRAC